MWRLIRNFFWANKKYNKLRDNVINEADPEKKRVALLKLSVFGDKYDIDVKDIPLSPFNKEVCEKYGISNSMSKKLNKWLKV